MIDTTLQIHPFRVRIRSSLSSVERHLAFFYGGYPRPPAGSFVDFDIQLLKGKGLRRWWRPQVRFLLDGEESFFPLPVEQAAPLFEWGLNWCIANRPLGLMVMHAGLLARSGDALMLPGFPGAGKSTLCASLSLTGTWRLLSDELAILDPRSGLMLANTRPISLKNASLDVVSKLPNAKLGTIYHDTRKGTISHAACTVESVQQANRPARTRWIVFPKFSMGATPVSAEISRVEAFSLIAEQSFNKDRMGESGFLAICEMLTGARCYRIEYGSTEDGLHLIESITAP